ncbi:hypothetical protein DPMN_120002 [Dreissena polymorpha]|uniref:Uncharacterized protein n=1 Tax=Dreissena polymorpha TaxID=45954 RepID=A0A9D4JSE8_DREPO|nr:hypothetical protein DPMN_120002 [Dreissena polymorpha]
MNIIARLQDSSVKYDNHRVSQSKQRRSLSLWVRLFRRETLWNFIADYPNLEHRQFIIARNLVISLKYLHGQHGVLLVDGITERNDHHPVMFNR